MIAGLVVVCVALTALILGILIGVSMVVRDFHNRVSDGWLPYIASDDGIMWRKRN